MYVVDGTLGLPPWYVPPVHAAGAGHLISNMKRSDEVGSLPRNEMYNNLVTFS